MLDPAMVSPCRATDVEAIHAIVNDAAAAYRGVIPADCWHEPYMSMDELQREIADGVRFFGRRDDGELVGVMGLQDLGDVTLLRHAYVRRDRQRSGIGSELLAMVRAEARAPILVGTWADADWAIDFYRRHAFRVLTSSEASELLERYWNVPARQAAVSVVLADADWR
jgi:GNAT superfamily N-acetyltransferase